MATRKKQGHVRIISGHWRGRKLAVADRPGLRPTADRIRETLFNWLQPGIEGARVVDVFAGTGALSFEALSRGASHALLLESDNRAVETLNTHATKLGANAEIVMTDARQYLRQSAPQPFDLVFLDPPFADHGITELLASLQAGWLSAGARVYVEQPADREIVLPSGFSAWREKRAGRVHFALYVVAEDEGGA